MKRNRIVRILSLLLCTIMLVGILPSCSDSSDGGADTTTEYSPDSNVMTPGVTIPSTEITDSTDGKARVVYAVNDSMTGEIDGSISQLSPTSGTVKAVPCLGYKFKCWSDGSTSPTRVGDTAEEGKTVKYYAVFEVECLKLPVIMLTTETGEDVTSKEEYIGGTLSATNCDSDFTLNSVGMQIRGRGNFSWVDVPKKSYKIKLDTSTDLLGLGDGKSKSWCLLANHCDQSLIRNYLTYQLCQKLSNIAWAPDCTNVEVYLNGQYQGVYLLIESIKVDEHRVAINEDIESGTDIGYLIQMTNNSDERFRFNVNGQNFDIKSDLSTDSRLANKQKSYINDYLLSCWDAVESGNRANIESLIDIDSVIDTYLVEEFNKNLDAGYDSFYMYKDKEGKLTFGPIWDFDLAFGNSDEHYCEYPEYMYIGGDYCNGFHSNMWYTTLMSYQWFRELVAQRWNSDEVQQAFGEISKLATSTARDGFNSYCRNFERWPIFGQCINRETELITSLKNYTEHYQYLAEWISNRFDWLNGFIGSDDYNNGKLVHSDRPNWWDGGGPKDDTTTVSYTYSGGSGTLRDPYLISTESDFVDFTDALTKVKYEGTYFKQTADLDMTQVNDYYGLGASGNFAGVYNGAGYNIHANIVSYDGCIFPYVSGTVMNLSTSGWITNEVQAAGICRSVRNGGALINCYSTMEVTSLTGNAGGLSPSTESGDTPIIVNCYFAGTLTGTEQNSPINCWLDGRGGTFEYLYYSADISVNGSELTTTDDDICLSDSDMKNELANILNSNIDNINAITAIYANSLCRWTQNDGYPVFVK